MLHILRPLVVLIFCFSFNLVQADIYLYGARHEVPHFGYGYDGLDWPEEYATCSGARQSPINVPGHTTFLRVPHGQKSDLYYGQLASTGNNIKVVNNGHTVQVVMPADFSPNTSVVVKGDTLVSKFRNSTGEWKRVPIKPSQFHFHARAEHVIDGKAYPLELHIVNWVYAPTLPACGAGGCATVVGVMFELADEPLDETTENTLKFLDAVWGVMPPEEGESAFIPAGTTLNFNHILPNDRSYVTYEGSLTTPPCTEGILWHVLAEPMKITKEHLIRFELAVGMTNCTAHDDPSFHIASATTPAPSDEFVLPQFQADAHDGLFCRKLAGQNFRDVQERDSRPLWFFPADAICEPELLKLVNVSKAMERLVYESDFDKGITLNQYHEIQAAGLTKSSGCTGAAGNLTAGGTRSAAHHTVASSLQVACIALVCWVLLFV